MRATTLWTLGLALLLATAVWALDGPVAVQSAQPSCRDDSGAAFVDCGNGTVTDNHTGLIWLKDANCLGAGVEVSFAEALAFVAGLADETHSDADDCGLSDSSSPGEWRLPTSSEWERFVADARALGCVPTVTDDLGTGCWSACAGGCSFEGVEDQNYWSSTTDTSDPANMAWTIDLDFPGSYVESDIKSTGRRLWPVRGGQ